MPNQSAYGLIPAIRICAPRFVGRDFSSMPSATIPCRPAMTVCFGACTRRPASVRTVNSRSRVTATIPYGSATARVTASEQVRLFSQATLWLTSPLAECCHCDMLPGYIGNIGGTTRLESATLVRPTARYACSVRENLTASDPYRSIRTKSVVILKGCSTTKAKRGNLLRRNLGMLAVESHFGLG